MKPELYGDNFERAATVHTVISLSFTHARRPFLPATYLMSRSNIRLEPLFDCFCIWTLEKGEIQ